MEFPDVHSVDSRGGDALRAAAAPKKASLLFAASHLLVLFLVLYVLYRTRILLKA